MLLAAGFDTRAYRLGRPGVTFYEVDLPVASACKQELVKKLRFVAGEVRAVCVSVPPKAPTESHHVPSAAAPTGPPPCIRGS